MATPYASARFSHRLASSRLSHDLKLVGVISLVTFPLYALGHVWAMENARALVIELGGFEYAALSRSALGLLRCG